MSKNEFVLLVKMTCWSSLVSCLGGAALIVMFYFVSTYVFGDNLQVEFWIKAGVWTAVGFFMLGLVSAFVFYLKEK